MNLSSITSYANIHQCSSMMSKCYIRFIVVLNMSTEIIIPYSDGMIFVSSFSLSMCYWSMYENNCLIICTLWAKLSWEALICSWETTMGWLFPSCSWCNSHCYPPPHRCYNQSDITTLYLIYNINTTVGGGVIHISGELIPPTLTGSTESHFWGCWFRLATVASEFLGKMKTIAELNSPKRFHLQPHH